MDEFFKRLAAMRGQFKLDADGRIRHRNVTDSYGELACPLVAATDLPGSHDNLEPCDAGKEIGLRKPSIARIVAAADRDEAPRKLRRRILETVGLSDPKGAT